MLALIPLILVGISGMLVAAGLTVSHAIPIAGLLVIVLIGHAMFVRTPGQGPGRATGPDAPNFSSAD